MGCCGSVKYNWQPGRTKSSDQDSIDLNDDKEAAREGGRATGGLGGTGGAGTLPASSVLLGHWSVLTRQETYPSLAGRSDSDSDGRSRPGCQVRLLESAWKLGSAGSLRA